MTDELPSDRHRRRLRSGLLSPHRRPDGLLPHTSTRCLSNAVMPHRRYTPSDCSSTDLITVTTASSACCTRAERSRRSCSTPTRRRSSSDIDLSLKPNDHITRRQSCCTRARTTGRFTRITSEQRSSEGDGPIQLRIPKRHLMPCATTPLRRQSAAGESSIGVYLLACTTGEGKQMHAGRLSRTKRGRSRATGVGTGRTHQRRGS